MFKLTVIACLFISTAVHAGTIAFSGIPSTNTVNSDDLLLLDSHLGGTNYATRTITVSLLPAAGNWVYPNSTNATLAGVASMWAGLVTNHLMVGYAPQQTPFGLTPIVYIGTNYSLLNSDIQTEGYGSQLMVANKGQGNAAVCFISDDPAAETSVLEIEDAFTDNGTQMLRNSMGVELYHYGPGSDYSTNQILVALTTGASQNCPTGVVHLLVGSKAGVGAYDPSLSNAPMASVDHGVSFLSFSVDTSGAVGTKFTNHTGFLASDYSRFDDIGAGSDTVVANEYGFRTMNLSPMGTNAYGFFSDLAPGVGKWAFYDNGGAQSWLNGTLNVGPALLASLDPNTQGALFGPPYSEIVVSTIPGQISIAGVSETTSGAVGGQFLGAAVGNDPVAAPWGLVGQAQWSSGTGTLGEPFGIMAGVVGFVANTATGGINEAAGLMVNNGSGSITNLYGLRINDQTAGVSNWAIKTGTGLNEFGDSVKAPRILFGTNILSFTGTNLTWNGTTITVP